MPGGVGWPAVWPPRRCGGCRRPSARSRGDLLAATGPSIGVCCFETDDDVPEAMRRALGAAAEPYMVRRGEKWHIDLKGINALWLRQAGVQRIDVCPDCTGCHPERWWSHRKMGDRRGAQAALIALI